MTDKEFVLSKYPNARACTVTFTLHWCIQDYWPGGTVVSDDADCPMTEAAAWVSAAKKIMAGQP